METALSLASFPAKAASPRVQNAAPAYSAKATTPTQAATSSQRLLRSSTHAPHRRPVIARREDPPLHADDPRPADHSSPARTCLLTLGLLACTGGEPAPDAGGHATLILDGAWSSAPWESGQQGPGPLTLTTTFRLPEDRLGAGSVLVLEGAWFRVEGTFNGQRLGPVNGGLAPVELPVGAALRAGENQLSLTVSPPGPEVPALLHGGGLASSGWQRNQPDLQVPPRLELRPTSAVTHVALPLEGGQVMPTARVTGAPDGARVRFSVSVDGTKKADLGEAPVQGGVATAPAIDWSLPTWAPGDPELVLARAELVDASGAPLDALAVRTGVVDIDGDADGLRLGDAPLRLMAVRVTNRDGRFAAPFSELVPGGVNGVEIHGELARSAWLDAADELGLPLVVVPRCVGRANKGRATPEIAAEQVEQDERLVAHLGHHPSPVLWATEGQTANSQKKNPGLPRVLYTDALQSDPLDRPITQVDLDARVQRVGAPDPDGAPFDSCAEEGCEGAWLTEVTWRGPATPEMWTIMSARTQHALTEGGAHGVVIPTPRPADRGGWAPAWARVGQALGIAPADPGPHRAASIVEVVSGTPGETVFLEAPGHPTVGAVFGADGTASIRLWHTGEVQVHVGGKQRRLFVQPGRWVDWVEKPNPLRLDLSRTEP